MRRILFYASILLLGLASCSKEKQADIKSQENTTTKSSPGKTLAAVTPTLNTWVSLIARHSDKQIQFPGFNIDDNAQVQQYGDGPGANGRFKITSVGTDIYRITPSMPYALSKALEVTGASTADGAQVTQYPYSGGTNQQWKFVDMGSGYFQIVNVKSGKALDIAGASTSDGVGAIQYTASSTAYNQQFKLVAKGATTVCTACTSCTPWVSYFVAGSWILMYNGSSATLASDGGTSAYTANYETAYWGSSGTIVPFTIAVQSGTNTLTSTTGTSAPGTCTGTAFPQYAYYSLNGSVKWTNNESGCDVNVALSSGLNF
ncbi:MAG: Ricin-type beta-trefoil lectin domain-like [Mucilaginibacter sp.]|nr:Ricin-type beta-trefoil lectin domain-like [Mucilaginibacter sp.]